jgi:hypothetical protein
MLRSACSVCRSLLLSSTVNEATGAIGMQYAACSFIKAVTSRNPHLAMAAARPFSAGGGGAGIVIDDSAVQVSSHASVPSKVTACVQQGSDQFNHTYSSFGCW